LTNNPCGAQGRERRQEALKRLGNDADKSCWERGHYTHALAASLLARGSPSARPCRNVSRTNDCATVSNTLRRRLRHPPPFTVARHHVKLRIRLRASLTAPAALRNITNCAPLTRPGCGPTTTTLRGLNFEEVSTMLTGQHCSDAEHRQRNVDRCIAD
jgi:hypothetical protein